MTRSICTFACSTGATASRGGRNDRVGGRRRLEVGGLSRRNDNLRSSVLRKRRRVALRQIQPGGKSARYDPRSEPRKGRVRRLCPADCDRKPEALRAACLALGGREIPMGELSFEIPLFDFLPVMVQFWSSDEEFPPVFKLMWDENVLMFLRFETGVLCGALSRDAPAGAHGAVGRKHGRTYVNEPGEQFASPGRFLDMS